MMKKIKYAVCLCVIACLCFAFPCFAAGNCTLTVSPDGGPLTVAVCLVARWDNGYTLADGFEDSGLSVSGFTSDNAQAVCGYVSDNEIAVQTLSTASGDARFIGLEKGVWLVFCGEDGDYYFEPFFVTLVSQTEVTSHPKTRMLPPDTRSISVTKKWDDSNNAAKLRPDSITVELICDGNTVQTVQLSGGNGWTHMFENVPVDGTFTVREKEVDGYKASYNGDAKNGFIITNTLDISSFLPDTGQHLLPAVILAVAGVCFILLGIIEHTKKKKDL